MSNGGSKIDGLLQIRELQQAEYAGVLANFPQRTVFHCCGWLESIAQIYDVEICYLGALAHDRLVGVVPVLVRRFAGLKVGGSPLPQVATPRLYPLVSEDRLHSFLEALRNWAEARGLAYLQVACGDSALRHCEGWETEIRDTLEVALDRDLESLWGSFNQNARRAVRQAIRKGVKLHWRRSRDFVDDVYRPFLQSTYERQGIRPNCPIEVHQDIVRRLPHRHWRILAASWQGKQIAAVWLLLDERRGYFWDGASDQAMRKLQANNLLHWAIIRWCRKRGVGSYDLLGGEASSGRGGSGRGIGRFKKSLGGAPSEYAVFVWQRRWMRAALALYRAYLRLRDGAAVFGRR